MGWVRAVACALAVLGASACSPGRTSAPPTVTAAEFESLKDGMSYEDAVRVIGVPGTEMSRTSLAGYDTVMYSWTNSDASNMNAMFQNDKLMSKAQFGLK